MWKNGSPVTALIDQRLRFTVGDWWRVVHNCIYAVEQLLYLARCHPVKVLPHNIHSNIPSLPEKKSRPTCKPHVPEEWFIGQSVTDNELWTTVDFPQVLDIVRKVGDIVYEIRKESSYLSYCFLSDVTAMSNTGFFYLLLQSLLQCFHSSI